MSSGHQGQTSHIASRLEDEDTQLALSDYLAGVGETVTAQGLANAISGYWQTGHLSLGNNDIREEEVKSAGGLQPSGVDSPDGKHLKGVQCTISKLHTTLSRRAGTSWLHKMGYQSLFPI